MKKYVIKRDKESNIDWILINKENGEKQTEIIGNDIATSFDKINKKYDDFYNKYFTGNYDEATKHIKNLKISTVAEILLVDLGIGVSMANYLTDTPSVLFGITIPAYIGGLSLSETFETMDKKFNLEEDKNDKLIKKLEKVLKEENLKTKIQNLKLSKNLKAITGTAMTTIALTSPLLWQHDPKIASLIALTNGAIGGYLHRETIRKVKEIKELPKNEEDYDLSEDEIDMLDKKIVNSRKIK